MDIIEACEGRIGRGAKKKPSGTCKNHLSAIMEKYCKRLFMHWFIHTRSIELTLVVRLLMGKLSQAIFLVDVENQEAFLSDYGITHLI